MATERRSAPEAPKVIERLVKQLVVTYKAVVLYPSGSDITMQNGRVLESILRQALATSADLRFGVSKEGLFYESVPVFPGNPGFEAFARELYNRNLSEVRFHAGVTAADLVCFLEALKLPPNELAAEGGLERHLWERQCDAVTVEEVSTKIVDAEGAAASEIPPGEPWPPSAQRIDELLVGAFGGRPRDQRLLVRVLQDPALIGSYFRETLAGRGSKPAEALISGQLKSFANAVGNELPGDQPALYRAVAEALLDLEPDIRRRVIRDKLLADARKDEALAALVRQMSVEDICKIVVEGLVEGEASQEGVSRAVRNLALIAVAGRDEVVKEAGVALAAAGVSEGVAGAVLEGAAPKRLRVVERPRSEAESPVDNVVRLVDLAPQGARRWEADPELEPLRNEARRGLTDGDVTGALVSLVTLDVRPEPFASVMSMIEDNVVLLLERGEFDIAADVATALSTSEQDRRLSAAQRRRARNAVTSMARPEQMRSLNRSLRLFAPGSEEHSACRRLLEILGKHAIDPLLEVLADEQDMAARKAIVDLISEMAPEFIEDLGKWVTDNRWYFVRNVVAILGNTKDGRILPYLERTIRHSDARVRRETIRSIAGVKDRRAEQMLAAALADEDGQNVALAARYLGASGSRGAVPSLEQVARAEGRGNREVSARVEAIEALARLNSTQSLTMLEALAGKSGLFGRGRMREVAAAAQAAVRQIQAASRRGGEPS